MPVKHVNRKRQTYFLHEGKTKTGKPKYFFSKDSEGNLLDAVPDGYEIYENPNAQVFCGRRRRKSSRTRKSSLSERDFGSLHRPRDASWT